MKLNLFFAIGFGLIALAASWGACFVAGAQHQLFTAAIAGSMSFICAQQFRRAMADRSQNKK